MNTIKVKCPAKINLDLKVFKKDTTTGFHPIKSTMQAISLFDFLTIKLENKEGIFLSGNSKEIPYDEKNLCYKAAKLFFDSINETPRISINIEKNIPVCAGLAGGSTDGAGVVFGLNKLFKTPLDKTKLHELLSKLGSDLNFCLEGGTKLCEKRGEKLTNSAFCDFELSLVKPKNLKISAKEAYEAFDNLNEPSVFKNDLEFALLNRHKELRFLNSKGMQMSGSGPTFFIKKSTIDFDLDKEYTVIEHLHTIPYGIETI